MTTLACLFCCEFIVLAFALAFGMPLACGLPLITVMAKHSLCVYKCMRAMCRYCIDGQSGKLIWQYGTAAMMRASFNFSESPTTGNTTVVFGSNDFNVSSALLESCLICVV
jgi:hypothetical protein